MTRHPPSISCSVTRNIIAFSSLLIALSANAAAPHEPQPAHLLPGDVVAGPALGDQTTPYLAAGGGGFLAVWADDRSTLLAGGGTGHDIYAARLAADGSLVDTAPVVVTAAPGEQTDPIAAWNGTDWLVVWTGSVPYPPYYTRITEGARVSGDGQLLDEVPFEIYPGGGGDEHIVGAASDGQNWAVVMTEVYVDGLSTNTRLVGRRISAAGAVTSAPYNLYSPSCCSFFFNTGMAYAGGVYMVVFEGYFDSWNYGIYGLRLSPSLTLLDTYPVELVHIAMQGETYFYDSPNIASDGTNFFVSWNLWHRDITSQIYGARVDPAGQSFDGDGVPISDQLPPAYQLQPRVTWTGQRWVIGWPESGQTQLARVDPLGGVLDPGGVATSLPTDLAFTGSDGALQLAWSAAVHAGPAPYDVLAARADGDLNIGPSDDISLGAPMQVEARIAHGETGALVAWTSRTADEARILVQPLDDVGDALGSEPTALASGDVSNPDVAWDGQRYLVVWQDGTQVRGARVDATGDVLDATPVDLVAGGDPATSGRDDGFLVVATTTGGATAVRVAGDGTVIDTTPLVLGTGLAGHASAAAVSNYWLAAWEQGGAPDGGDIVMALVDGAGNVGGPLPVTVAGDGIAAHAPAIAAGDTVLVAWQDGRSGNLDLYGRRFTSGLTAVDPAAGIALVTASGDQSDVATAWDGVRFVTDFTDTRDRINNIDDRIGVYRSWLPAQGPAYETTGVSLFPAEISAGQAAVTGALNNQIYVASVFTPEPPYANYRLQVRATNLPTAVGDVPVATRLLSAYPNPANPAVNIRFTLGRAGAATIDIFDARGYRVRSLRAANLGAGEHAMLWNGRDDGGAPAPSGSYLYRLRADGVSATGKLMLVQ